MATNFTEKTVSYVSAENGNYSIRSLHVHATQEEWEQPPLKSYIPEEGEIVVYDKASEDGQDLIKIGDGKTLVGELQFSGSQVSSVNGKSGIVELSAQDVGARPDTWTPTASQVGAVPTSRKVNNKALSSDISLSATDVGAAPSSHVTENNNPHGVTAEQIGASSIPHTMSGNIISVNDSGDAPLPGLSIYGKTVQNGTPTPENPAPLESVGAGGAICVTVAGRNLLGGEALADKLVAEVQATKDEANGTVVFSAANVTGAILFYPLKQNTQYTIILYGNNSNADKPRCNIGFEYTDGTYDILNFATAGEPSYCVYSSNPSKQLAWIAGWTNTGKTTLYYDKCGIFEGVLTEADFEPYKGQTLTAFTPNGLPGIPVTSGGNYTDEKGQQWICDEIDFTRGVYVQRVVQRVFDGTEDWLIYNVGQTNEHVYLRKTNSLYPQIPMCNMFRCDEASLAYSAKDTVASVGPTTDITIYRPSYIYPEVTSADAWKTKLAELAANGTPMVYQYALATPTETPLSAEELAQYAALHSNKPNTTVFNDSDAEMEIRYFTPNAAVPINFGGSGGKVLGIDEHGCVTTKTLK